MPTYLIHGFRWPRGIINIYMITQDLKDSSCNWLMSTNTTRDLLNNFREKYPSVMEALPNLRFIEEYSINQRKVSAEHAYVADIVHEVSGAVDIDETRQQSISDAQWSATCQLRDHLCGYFGSDPTGVKLGWYVVVCDDPDRFFPNDGDEEGYDVDDAVDQETIKNGDLAGERKTPARRGSLSHGLKKVFGMNKMRKSTSMKDLKNPRAMHSSTSAFTNSMTTASPSPPPPPIPPQYQNEVARLRSRSQHSTLQRPATSAPAPGAPLPGTAT